MAEENTETTPTEAAIPAEAVLTDAQKEENTLRELGNDDAYVEVPVNIKTLMDAGAHFGHQVERWSPKMAPFIFAERNGVHIINLDLTVQYFERAAKYVTDLMSRGGEILFVGTKNQARDVVRAAADRSGSFYVNQRWLGGTLSNFQTIKNSISRIEKLEQLLKKSEEPDSKIKLVKKEKTRISKELAKLENSLGGIRGMRRLPSLIFVVDIVKEAIAIREARRLHIPVVALVDTNTDPQSVNFPIPSNDDSTRTIELFTNAIADAARAGKAEFRSRTAKEDQERKAQGSQSNGKGKKKAAAARDAAVESSVSAN